MPHLLSSTNARPMVDLHNPALNLHWSNAGGRTSTSESRHTPYDAGKTPAELLEGGLVGKGKMLETWIADVRKRETKV